MRLKLYENVKTSLFSHRTSKTLPYYSPLNSICSAIASSSNSSSEVKFKVSLPLSHHDARMQSPEHQTRPAKNAAILDVELVESQYPRLHSEVITSHHLPYIKLTSRLIGDPWADLP